MRLVRPVDVMMDEAGRDRLPPARLRLSSCVDNGARRLRGGQPAVTEPGYVYVTTRVS